MTKAPHSHPAADLMKMAMARLHERLPDGAFITSMVHDEIIVECPDAISDEVINVVESALQQSPGHFSVPMAVESRVVGCWADAK